MKKALIFGVTGQSGSYLAELLLSQGYRVVGVSRRVSVPTDERVRHLRDNDNFIMVDGDITDPMCVYRLITTQAPDETYNLAAQSHVKVSFDEPTHTTNTTYLGCLNCLEAIRIMTPGNRPRFYQASSSEMFGKAWSCYDGGRVDDLWVRGGCPPADAFQDELTPMLPCSPYAIAKLAAHHLCRVYRDSYGIFACSGILFNHESPRRSETFVTRKITKYVASWLYAKRYKREVPTLRLGNLEAKRDWGHAADYVRAMWLMLQTDSPGDYVVATGETHSVREFLAAAKAAVGQEGEDLPVLQDESLFRPCEVPLLRGDASRARDLLGWKPEIGFAELVKQMVYADTAVLWGVP